MTELIIDLTNYRDSSSAHIPEGTYAVVVEDAELTKSSKGNPMINLWLRVNGGEHDGATLVDRLTQTEAALFRTVAFMQAIGMPTPKKRLKLNLQQFIGKHLMVEVEDGDPYRGRIKSEVRGYLRSKNAPAAEQNDLDDLEDEGVEDEQTAPTEAAAPAAAATTVVDDGPVEVDLETIDLG